MNKRLLFLLGSFQCALLSPLVGGAIGAISIQFDPPSQTVTLGSPTDVALIISGLGDSATPSLGTFDIDVSFDAAILSFSGATFGTQLDLNGFGDVNSATPGVGTVNLFDLSVDSASDLDSLQPGSFTLVTLSFNTIGTGTSPLTININALGDSAGQVLSATLSSGSIEVIPEPSTAILVVGAVSSMLGFLKLRKR